MEPDTVDADLWARLKLDYERHCYQQAEMLVRKRLQRLLTSRRCRIEPASPVILAQSPFCRLITLLFSEDSSVKTRLCPADSAVEAFRSRGHPRV
jgi:hypothetical protein